MARLSILIPGIAVAALTLAAMPLGRLRYRFVGETHAGDARALEIERRIGELLSE